eukprot:gene1466-1849_t
MAISVDKSLVLFIVSCLIPPVVLLAFLQNSTLQWNIIQSTLFSVGAGILTFKLIPTIADLTSQAGLTGMDLNKKGDSKYSGKKIPESLGICTSVVFLVCVIVFQLFQWFSFPQSIQLSEYNAALMSICFMILLGFSDDVLNLRWRYKLILPLFASLPLLVAYAGGTSVVVPDIRFPIELRAYFGKIFDLGVFYHVYLIMLAIFCTNSINILAGINGLEVGQSIVIAASIIVHNIVELTLHTTLYKTQVASDIITTVTTVPASSPHLLSIFLMIPFLFTTISLLCYNWYPSRVFVGDTFTYFSGMCFAVVAILCHFGKTLLLFFIPQILNFLYSCPQLFGLIECPRHRVPRFNPQTGKMEAIPTNLTLLNLFLLIFGPMTEKQLVSSRLLPSIKTPSITTSRSYSNNNSIYDYEYDISERVSNGQRNPQFFHQIYEKHRDIANKKFTNEETMSAIRKNSLFTWNPSEAAANGALVMTGGDGVFFYDDKGKKYIDFNSQAMCSNLGHTVPKEVIDAINNQLKSVAYCYPCGLVTETKAKLSMLLADILPGDLDYLYYTSGGAESNETAIRMARLFTGKHKILSRYRSYHGSTLGAIGLTGDPRRWSSEPASTSGVVHFMDPFPLNFQWGRNQEQITEKALAYLREVIEYEGPQNIAAIFLESITGTNGILIPPRGYLEGVRKICNQHSILMVCDEVMNGFGRTGTMFGFENSSPMVVPDIVTMAKGINGAFLPLGAVACRSHIGEYFKTHGIGIGSTYNSHPVALASAYGSLQYFLKNNVLDNVRKMAPILRNHLFELKKKHRCIKNVRSIGLFGIIELQQNAKGDPFVPYNGPPHPVMTELKKNLINNGLYTLVRWSSFFTNPPLIISKEELDYGFNIIDRCLDKIDPLVESNEF